MKSLSNTLLLFLYVFIAEAQVQVPPPIQWQKVIGGNSADEFSSIVQLPDSGYIIGGSTLSGISGEKTMASFGSWDYWIVRSDPYGNILWQKVFGGDKLDALTSVSITNDQGFVLGGYSLSGITGNKTDSSRGGSDYWVIKLDPQGNAEWQKTIGGNYPEEFSCIKQTIDGGFILGGSSLSPVSGDKTDSSRGGFDFWLVKLDNSGNIQWQRTIGGDGFDYLVKVEPISDGGYMLGGRSLSGISGEKTDSLRGNFDYWIVKVDSLGFIQWQRTLGGNGYDGLFDLVKTQDKGYILGGTSYSNISGEKSENSRGIYDYWIIKTDSLGIIQWQRTIGGSDGDYLYSIVQTSDQGYFLGGSSVSNISGEKTENNHGNFDDYWVIKTDSAGTIEWQKTIGGSSLDVVGAVFQNYAGDYVVGGWSDSGIGFEKTDSSRGLNDYWILNLGTSTFLPEMMIENLNNINIFPNPSTGIFYIKSPEPIESIKVLDVTGRHIPLNVLPGTFKCVIDVSGFSDGMYFIKVYTISNTYTMKCILKNN